MGRWMEETAAAVFERESELNNKETHYNNELKKCRRAQRKVAEMASRLKEKNDEMKDRGINLEKRMMECDAIERQLRHWQRELEEGGTTLMSRDGSDLGFSF